jgi:hypothetical protein
MGMDFAGAQIRLHAIRKPLHCRESWSHFSRVSSERSAMEWSRSGKNSSCLILSLVLEL